MTNTKISLREAYDNRDVIAQIVDLRTEAGEATDASANAVSTSNHAATLAGNAVDTANAASAVANGIDAKATQALEKSAEAVTASHKAEGTADAASAVADAAAATANGIDGKAQNALDTAGDAMLEASDASAKALAVDKKVDASNVRIGALEQTEGQHDARISTLQRDLNNVKAEYLDKFDLTDTQLIRSKTDFEREPLIPTIKAGDVDKDNGRRGVNYAVMKRDSVMLNDPQVVAGVKDYVAAQYPVTGPRTLMNAEVILNKIAFAIPPNMGMQCGEDFMRSRAKIVGFQAFLGSQLKNTDVEMQTVEYVGGASFYASNMASLKMNVPCTFDIGAFFNVPGLKVADIIPFYVPDTMFDSCANLETLVIRTDRVVDMSNVNALNGTRIASGNGSVYVPDALVEQYKAATNWVVYASKIKPISALPAEVSA